MTGYVKRFEWSYVTNETKKVWDYQKDRPRYVLILELSCGHTVMRPANKAKNYPFKRLVCDVCHPRTRCPTCGKV